jgi:hypothetical protein
MCQLCDAGFRQNHFGSRRSFLKGAAATGIAAAGGLKLFAPRPAAADAGGLPNGTGMPGRRYLLRNASVMSMDPAVGDFSKADVLIEGKKIVAVAPNLQGSGAAVIDVSGRIVMPGFIDTHHHQFETAMRGWLADGVLIGDNSGSPSGSRTYYENILLKFSPVYRPQDVYINELFAGLSQLDDGVTTVHDVSQIHHSPQHSDAAIQALIDTGRRAAFGYFEGAGQGVVIVPPSPKYAYPQDAHHWTVVRGVGRQSLEQRARAHDHGRGGLPRERDDPEIVDDRTPAQPSNWGAHSLAIRHPPDFRRARRGPRRRDR